MYLGLHFGTLLSLPGSCGYCILQDHQDSERALCRVACKALSSLPSGMAHAPETYTAMLSARNSPALLCQACGCLFKTVVSVCRCASGTPKAVASDTPLGGATTHSECISGAGVGTV
jgi:hypothetical protein